MSDETGTLLATVISDDGTTRATNTLDGLIERDNRFWVENVPLNGTNWITVQATDAAGNVTVTNFTLYPSQMTLTIDYTPTGDDLWLPSGFVSGTVSDPTATVTINGVTATVDPEMNGAGSYDWSADNAPLYGQGTATFDAQAVPAEAGMMDARTATDIEKNPITIISSYGGGYVEHSAYEQYSQHDLFVKGYVNQCLPGPGNTFVQDFSGVYSELSGNEQDQHGGNVTHIRWSTTNPGGSGFILTDLNEHKTIDSQHVMGAWIVVPNHFTINTPGDSVDFFAHNQHYHKDYPKPNGGVDYRDVAADAQTSMTLYTGGKGIINRQNLFTLSGWAIEYGPPSLSRNMFVPPWYGSTHQQVPIGRIQVMGHLGYDGTRWQSLPDNKPIDITPTVDGSQHYYALSGGAKFKVHIEANSHNLDNETPEFCVGELVNFELKGLPEGVVDMVGGWSLPQKFKNEKWQHTRATYTDPTSGAVLYENYGSVNYRINSSLLQNTSKTACWFYNRNDGLVSVGLSLKFQNGQTASVAAKGSLSVYRPSVSVALDDGVTQQICLLAYYSKRHPA
jgi:hypothetical protein